MTSLTMYIFQIGIADQQAVEQFTEAFDEFVGESDPGWGDVVIAAGIHDQVFHPHKGDVNLYWWWSGSDREDWLEYYAEEATVRPSAILCTSRKMLDHAKAKGYKAAYMPVATGKEFFPMDLPRLGVGYCGTRNHKDREQVRCMVPPGTEWRTLIPGGRPELNEWYNSKAVCVGMTATVTESWGIVPSRTYEVLAGANPYVTYRHWDMERTLGFDYPYQSSSPEETCHWIEELTRDPREEEFRHYSEIVLRDHTWTNRVHTLRDLLEG